jgi:mitochondrial enoyl-[acyl-carrier protein] reductase / trans-2-enoyl-CoA reductase
MSLSLPRATAMAQLITRSADQADPNEPPRVDVHAWGQLSSPGPDEVHVKFLACPIHPLDLLVLAGKYPVQPKYHHNNEAILGYDGIGEIISCGANVSTLFPGDLVIPSQFGIGTWRSHAIVNATMLQKTARPKDTIFASLLRLGVCPAYCLVEDICALQPGDSIIQNAGTSVIAQFVTQFANMRGIRVIHVIRDRLNSEYEATKTALLDAGADAVLTESELVAEGSALKDSRHIVLALDAVYGSSGSALLNTLSDGGTYVQLGFLGGQQGELQLGSGELFGRRLTLTGFRGSDRIATRTPDEQSNLFDWWVDMFNRDLLKLPALGLCLVEWEANDGGQVVVDAIRRAHEGKLGQRKQVLVFSER